MNYRIIASDLDGTLLDNHSAISEENFAAIHRIATLGGYFVPCTGRTLCELRRDLRDNPDVRYIIHSNGAVVYDKQTKKRVVHGLSRDEIAAVLSALEGKTVHLTVRHKGQSYIDAQIPINEENGAFYCFDRGHLDVLQNYAFYIESFKEWLLEQDNVEGITAFFRHSEERAACRDEIARQNVVQQAGSAAHSLEFSTKAAGKGNALLHLADMLSIPHEETIGVGDSENDFTLIEKAGLGLAVGNAIDSLKSMAKGVICTNEEHAIDYIVKNYLH